MKTETITKKSSKDLAALKDKKAAQVPTVAKKAAKHDAATKAVIADKVRKERDVKYLYPDDVITKEDKKKFREKVRKDLMSMAKSIDLIGKKKKEGDLEKEIKAFEKYRKQVMQKDATATVDSMKVIKTLHASN